MNKMQAKKVNNAIVFTGLTVGVLFCGCSMDDNHHKYKEAAIPSGKPVIINLADNTEYQPLLKGRPQTCGMRSGRVYLNPGEDCGQHSTEAHEEMLVFLSGKGTAITGDQQHEEYAVGQGKISYIPPYTVHNIRNTGVEPLVYIYCVAPANPNYEDHCDEQEHHH